MTKKKASIPVPKKVIRYVIVSPNGEIVSGRRPRESGAWVNATFKRGIDKKDYEAQKIEIERLKKEGYRCEEREGASRGEYATHHTVGNSTHLHMRMSPVDKNDLDKLCKFYSDKEHIATISFVIRMMMDEKIEEIKSEMYLSGVLSK